MPRFKIVDGIRTQFTEAEELERDAEEQAFLDEAPDRARQERDMRLSTDVDPIVSNALRWNDMTDAKRTEWTNYRQALLDIEDLDGYPDNITWPTKP